MSGKAKKKPAKKDMREERFPYEYVIDLNGQKAAERCGVLPAGARVWASRLLTKPNIQAKIKELQEAANKRAIKTAEDWEREVDLIAFSNARDFIKEDGTLKDLKELTPEQAAVIDTIVESRMGDLKVRTFNRHNKIKALDMKGKRLGIYRTTVVVEDPFAKYIEQLEKKRKDLAQGKKS